MMQGQLELHILRSGDHGVCMAVVDAQSGDIVCVDCGISGSTFSSACSEAGLNPFKVRAFLVTHGHGNQVKGIKSTLAWLAKRGVSPLVYIAPSVRAATGSLAELDLACVRDFQTLHPFDVGSITVRPFRTFHNNEDKGGCYNFRFEAGEGEDCDAIALLSDAGVVSREASGELVGVRVLGVEANYDAAMFERATEGSGALRFAVDMRGNFSNTQAAAVVKAFAWEGLEDVVALYLSRQHNKTELVEAALQDALAEVGCTARVTVALPDAAVSILPRADGDEQFDEILTYEEAAARGLLSLDELAAALGAGAWPVPQLRRALEEAGLLDPSDGFPTQRALDMGAWVAVRETEDATGNVETSVVFPQASLEELRVCLGERP